MRRVLELAWQNQIPLSEVLETITKEESAYRVELEQQDSPSPNPDQKS
jgi:hypothetical protein